jgi:hypothetical protein
MLLLFAWSQQMFKIVHLIMLRPQLRQQMGNRLHKLFVDS